MELFSPYFFTIFLQGRGGIVQIPFLHHFPTGKRWNYSNPFSSPFSDRAEVELSKSHFFIIFLQGRGGIVLIPFLHHFPTEERWNYSNQDTNCKSCSHQIETKEDRGQVLGCPNFRPTLGYFSALLSQAGFPLQLLGRCSLCCFAGISSALSRPPFSSCCKREVRTIMPFC